MTMILGSQKSLKEAKAEKAKTKPTTELSIVLNVLCVYAGCMCVCVGV